MGIRYTQVDPEGGQNIRFPDHQLAHQYCVGRGIALGESSHNRFSLADCRNVAPRDDFDFYRSEQIAVDGCFAEVDHWAEAHRLPFENDSLDYVISSHVFEHLPNPIAALREWNCVVRDGGIVFMIVPLRNAHPGDVDRPITTFNEFLDAYLDDYTPVTHPFQEMGNRGHYHVFTIDSVKELVAKTVIGWTLEDEEEVDSKVGNGFTLVFRVNKPTGPAETA
jgi:SAM-dependent methyltransferase